MIKFTFIFEKKNFFSRYKFYFLKYVAIDLLVNIEFSKSVMYFCKYV